MQASCRDRASAVTRSKTGHGIAARAQSGVWEVRVVVGFEPTRARSIQRSFTVHGDADLASRARWEPRTSSTTPRRTSPRGRTRVRGDPGQRQQPPAVAAARGAHPEGDPRVRRRGSPGPSRQQGHSRGKLVVTVP